MRSALPEHRLLHPSTEWQPAPEYRHSQTTEEFPADRRQEILRLFASGDIQVLVAIRCLDEGVDVPATQTAFILASSTNPRQFVQRRGRLLRRSPGKRHAEIYD